MQNQRGKCQKKGLVIISLLSVMAAAFLSGCKEQQAAPSASVPETAAVQERNTVTVSAGEKVMVVPDRAEIVFGVTTQAANAAACQEQNTQQVDQVIELLKNSGMEESSIRTGDYWLNPRYDWSGSQQKLIGYEMHTGITLSGVPLEQVGELLAGAVESGVNTIDSVTYSSSKYDENYQEALKLAAVSARAKAETLAAAENCSVLGVMEILEYSDESSAKYTDYSINSKMQKQAAGAVEDLAAAAVMPGEVAVNAQITVTYEIG